MSSRLKGPSAKTSQAFEARDVFFCVESVLRRIGGTFVRIFPEAILVTEGVGHQVGVINEAEVVLLDGGGRCDVSLLCLLQLVGHGVLDIVDDLPGDFVEIPFYGFLGVVVLPVAVLQLAVGDGKGFASGVAEGEVEGGRDENADVNCPPVASSSRVTGVDGVGSVIHKEYGASTEAPFR